MNPDPNKLLQEALTLSPEARGALAARLLDSLDETVDAASVEQWDREIARRAAELDQGQVKTVPWSEVRRQLAGSSE